MKKEKDFELWIREQIKRYVPMLGLELYEIKIKKGDKEQYLEITCEYPYLCGTIKYTDEAKDDWRKGEIAPDRILHELCHIITDPLYVKAIERHSSKEEIKDEREKLTDYIAAIVRKIGE